MSSVNISLPSDQVSFIDSMVSKYGFASRSELFRAVLRLVRHKPELVDQASVLPLDPPSTRSIAKILSGFQNTGKYSPDFLKDLKSALSQSDYFT